MGACAAASAGSRGIAGPHCSPGTSGLGGKDRRRASAEKLGATAAPPDGDAWAPCGRARRGQEGGLVTGGPGTVRGAALEPCGPAALGTRRASTSKGETRERCSECALSQCYGRPLLIPHTLGRVERASTASFRSIFVLWERWKKARWWRRVCVRFCAHDFPKSTSRAPAFPPCASVL